MSYLLALTLLVAPLYVWRFSLFGLPVNFLMVWLALVWLLFAVRLIASRQVREFVRCAKRHNPVVLILVGLFLLAGFISLFVGGVSLDKFGQFLVLFVQPVGTYFVVSFEAHKRGHSCATLRTAMYLFLLASGLLALLQYFWLIGLPPDFWGNANEPKRAIGFFAHPNGFGLALAPLLAFLLPDLVNRLENWRRTSSISAIISYLAGCVALLLSLSRGSWFGLAAAIVVYLIFFSPRRFRLPALAALLVAVIVIVSVPTLRYRLVLPFYGEKSAVARLSLWRTGHNMIQDSPVLGKGLTGFSANWERYNADPNLDHYNFPHNIVLNSWVDTGLLGLLSFMGLLLYSIARAFRQRGNSWATGLALFSIAMIVHGLIDIPYFKNDLALLFWLAWSLAI